MDQIDFSNPDLQGSIDELAELWGSGERDEACTLLFELEDCLGVDTVDPAAEAIGDTLYRHIANRIGNRGTWSLIALHALAFYEQQRVLAYESTEIDDETRARVLAGLVEMEREFDELEIQARELGIEFRRPSRMIQS